MVVGRTSNFIEGYEDINNIISIIMSKRGLKTIEILKEEISVALKERGYADEKIAEWLEYVE